MGLKTKIGMAMATSAAGAAMVVGGSFALFSAEQSTTQHQNFAAGTVKLNVDNGFTVKETDQQLIGNMAPGDTATFSFNVQNTGTLDEWVSLETGAANYNSPAGTALGQKLYQTTDGTDSQGHVLGLFSDFASSVDKGEKNHGISDQTAAGSGDTSMYTPADPNADMHHATWTYSVDILDGANANANVVPTVDHQTLNGDGSMNDFTYNHPFILRSGQSAKVTYTVTLPLGAHNDYQGLTGFFTTEVDAVQARNNWYIGGSPSNKGTGDIAQGAAVGKDAGTQEVWPLSWQPDSPS